MSDCNHDDMPEMPEPTEHDVWDQLYRERDYERARADSLAAELEEYRIRLAGALVAADGGGPEHFDNPNVWESVRTCPTIAKVRQIRAERDSLTASITAACAGTGCVNAHELAETLRQARADRDVLVDAATHAKDLLDAITPDRNCSCHLGAPCSDCVDNSENREIIEELKNALTRAGGGE